MRSSYRTEVLLLLLKSLMVGTGGSSTIFSFYLMSSQMMERSFSTHDIICWVEFQRSYLERSRYIYFQRHQRRYLFLQQSWWYFSPTIRSTDSLLSCTIFSIYSAMLLIFSFLYRSISATIASYMALISFSLAVNSFLANSSTVFHFDTASLLTLMLRDSISALNFLQRPSEYEGSVAKSMNSWCLQVGSKRAHFQQSSFDRFRSTTQASLSCTSQYSFSIILFTCQQSSRKQRSHQIFIFSSTSIIFLVDHLASCLLLFPFARPFRALEN